MHHAHTHISTPPGRSEIKDGIQRPGSGGESEDHVHFPAILCFFAPCSPGAKPPFEIPRSGDAPPKRHCRRPKRLTRLGWLGPSLLHTMASLGPVWRMERLGDGPSASMIGFHGVPMWVSHGRATCLAELSAEEGAEERAGLVEDHRRGASSTKKQPANHGRHSLCDGDGIETVPNCRGSFGLVALYLPKGRRDPERAPQYQASRFSQHAARSRETAAKRRWCLKMLRGESRGGSGGQLFAAIQPPLRNSCERREG